MTITRHQPINSSNFSNFGNPKINKRFEDAPAPLTPSGDSKSAIDFSKQNQELPITNAGGDLPLPSDKDITEADLTSELSDAEKRAERRASFKHAADIERRAMQMQKEAEHTLNQTKQVQQFLALIDTDPVKAVQALGKDPNDILRKYQNGMFNIPNEPEKPKVESTEEKLARYESERKREKEEILNYKLQNDRSMYIQNNILPVITAEPDTFELLNMNGVDTCAGFIYDMMNAHFQSTGETLNARDVAEEMENQLTNEFEDKIKVTRGIKKLSKHFRTDTDAPGDELTLPKQLGEGQGSIQLRQSAMLNQAAAPTLNSDTSTNTKPYQGLPQSRPLSAPAVPSPSQLLGSDAQANSYQRQTSVYNKKQARLNKIEEYARVNDIKRNI